MGHGPIFFAQNTDITCKKKSKRSAKSKRKFNLLIISETWLIKLKRLPTYLLTLDRFSCSKRHLLFKMAFEKIGPYWYNNFPMLEWRDFLSSLP